MIQQMINIFVIQQLESYYTKTTKDSIMYIVVIGLSF